MSVNGRLWLQATVEQYSIPIPWRVSEIDAHAFPLPVYLFFS